MLDPEYVAYVVLSGLGAGHDGGGIYLDLGGLTINYRHYDSGNSIDTGQSTSFPSPTKIYPSNGTFEADVTAAAQAQVKAHAEAQWLGITVNANDVQVIIL